MVNKNINQKKYKFKWHILIYTLILSTCLKGDYSQRYLVFAKQLEIWYNYFIDKIGVEKYDL